MDFSEKYGRTIEEAAQLAAADLNLTIDDVEIEVLEEPSKGFLGIGARSAKVRVTPKKTSENTALEFVKETAEKMGLDLKITSRQSDNIIFIDIEGKDSGTIIGKRGQTLDSLQYLVNLVVNKNTDKYMKVVVNAENYREKRESTLEQLAIRLAGKVSKTRRSVRLEPMNPYERKVIHTTLQDDVRVNTKSEGEEPYRRVVIEPRRGHNA
ncbi:MAG: RNA-binding cell elongation regulator Jag/EloR [Bacillota bacterium]|nr:RNA-binding cell elongation regulator Jag/EloR [Bacillota bacterium]